jgi:hypothetical protein
MRPRSSSNRGVPASAKVFQAFRNALGLIFGRPDRQAVPAFSAGDEERCRVEREKQLARFDTVNVPQHEAVVYRWRASDAK